MSGRTEFEAKVIRPRKTDRIGSVSRNTSPPEENGGQGGLEVRAERIERRPDAGPRDRFVFDPRLTRKDSIMRPAALVPVAFALFSLVATGCASLNRCGSCGLNQRGIGCNPCGGIARERLAQNGHCRDGGGGLLGAIRGRAFGGEAVCGRCGLRGRLGGQCGRCGLPLLGGPTEGTPYTEPFAGPYGPTGPTVGYPYYTTRAPRDFLNANPPSIGR